MTRRLLTLPEFRHWLINPDDPDDGDGFEPEVAFEVADDGGPSDFTCDQSPRVLYEIVKNVEFTDDEWDEFVMTLGDYCDFADLGFGPEKQPTQTELFVHPRFTYEDLYESGFLMEWPVHLDRSTARKMVKWASYHWDNLAPLPEPWTPA